MLPCGLSRTFLGILGALGFAFDSAWSGKGPSRFALPAEKPEANTGVNTRLLW